MPYNGVCLCEPCEIRLGSDLCSGLFTVVPNISRQLPVTSDLLPDHNVLPRDFFWRRIFSLQAEVSPFLYAALGPSDLTSSVVTLGSITCSAMCSHITLIGALPFTKRIPVGGLSR